MLAGRVAARRQADSVTAPALWTQHRPTAELLRDIAGMLEGMADAIDDDDGILGSLCSEGLANLMPALPKHVRDVLADLLTDEAARSFRADLAYLDPHKEKDSCAS